jgi:hypothetical protein
VPELDDGVDDPLLRPELEELELDEPVLEPDEPELDEPEPTLVEPELWVPEDDPVDPVDPVVPEVELCDEDVPLLEPGSVRAMAPAVTTLASPTVAVVVLIRLRPRARAAAARRTLSRFGVFMTGSLPSSSGEAL